VKMEPRGGRFNVEVLMLGFVRLKYFLYFGAPWQVRTRTSERMGGCTPAWYVNASTVNEMCLLGRTWAPQTTFLYEFGYF
jgi:hypothetical protein